MSRSRSTGIGSGQLKEFFSIAAWLEKLPRQTRLLVVTVGYALLAALAAVAFQLGMNALYRHGLATLATKTTSTFIIGSFFLTIGGALVVGCLLHAFGAEASGSGIPQLKAALWKDFGFVRARVIWVKFVAGIIQIGSGSSLGREGPSVQLAGAIGSNLAGLAGQPKQRRRHGAATGAAAGLAAAFNTPLAAVTFVLEELIGDLNSRLLGSILLASMVGALVTHGIIGPYPAFSLLPVGEPTWRAYSLVPIVAIAASLVGAAFQKSSLFVRGQSRCTNIPGWLQPAIGALVCWLLGILVFIETGRLGVFGLGYDDLSDALAGKMAWHIAAVLLVAKFVATVACYGSGGCGGIFSPTLFLGATTGIALAGVASAAVPLKADGVAMLAVVGMSATLGAVVRAPVTSILIVFEMTHEFALVPPLMLTALISQTISHFLLRRNFYDALLQQDGHDVHRFVPLRDLMAWHRQEAIGLANNRAVVIESLAPEVISDALKKYPYENFPVVENGNVAGVLSRIEAEAALKMRATPVLHPLAVCRPTDSIKDIEKAMVDKGATMAVLMEEAHVRGVLTLHDLLRAQLRASERGETD